MSLNTVSCRAPYTVSIDSMAAKKKDPILERVGMTKKFTFTGLDKKEYAITDQQRLFAEYYMDPFLSGAQAVIEAGYDCTNSRGDINMRLASSIASENLRKPNICQYIATLIDDAGLNDNVVNKHLLYNITQFVDLKAKNVAIDIYNKLGRKYGNAPDMPTINAPKTKREEDLTFNLLKRLNEYQRSGSETPISDS